MQLLIVAMGKTLPNWLEQGIADYVGRFPNQFKLQIKGIPLRGGRNRKDVRRYLELEADAIQAAIPEGAHTVVLDSSGTTYSSFELAQRLRTWQSMHKLLTFLIGGPEGLSTVIKRKIADCWSLSPLTLPHGIARLLVVESLYRAITILRGHPYHHG